MKYILTIVFGVLLCLSCSKEESGNQTAVPNVPFEERINVNDPSYINLRNIGGWIYHPGGSRGLIIYHESTNVYRAYERHCTFDPQDVCSTLEMDATNFIVSDFDCCGSQFSIANGYVLQGPAVVPMISYPTSFDGTYLTVTNN